MDPATYGDLLAEYADADRIDAEQEIAQARSVTVGTCSVRAVA